MSIERNISKSMKRRATRVREKLTVSPERPRVCIFRSLNHIYAQIIDDSQHKTIVSCSSLELENLKGDKKKIAYEVGKELAKRASKAGINAGTFDRGRFLYHGRIKALADGLREGGMQI